MVAELAAKTRVLAIALALAIFAGGAAAGVAIDRLWLTATAVPAAHHMPPHEAVIERFRKRLDLTDEQVVSITKIVKNLHSEVQALHGELGNHSREAHDRARTLILGVLTPEQATNYNDMIRTMHKQHHGGSFGPHQPGPHHGGPHGAHKTGHPHGP